MRPLHVAAPVSAALWAAWGAIIWYENRRRR